MFHPICFDSAATTGISDACQFQIELDAKDRMRYVSDPRINARDKISFAAKLDTLGQISDNRRQIDGMATEMNLKSLIFIGFSGATRRIRTDDLLITNQPRGQLSKGIFGL